MNIPIVLRFYPKLNSSVLKIMDLRKKAKRNSVITVFEKGDYETSHNLFSLLPNSLYRLNRFKPVIEKKLGPSYAEYKRKTPMLIPGLAILAAKNYANLEKKQILAD